MEGKVYVNPREKDLDKEFFLKEKKGAKVEVEKTKLTKAEK